MSISMRQTIEFIINDFPSSRLLRGKVVEKCENNYRFS